MTTNGNPFTSVPAAAVEELHARVGSALVATVAGASSPGLVAEWVCPHGARPNAQQARQISATLDVLGRFDDDAGAFIWLLDEHDDLQTVPALAMREGRITGVLEAAVAHITRTARHRPSF